MKTDQYSNRFRAVFSAVLGLILAAVMLAPTAKADGIDAWGYNAWGQSDAPSGDDFVDISASYYHSLALRSDGTLAAWGYNGWGENNVPALPAGVVYTGVASGMHHNVALRSDGTAVGFGYNGNGQNNIANPPAGVSYTQASAGYQNTLLLRSDGEIVAFGYNQSGANNVPALPAGLTYTQVAAGYYHSLALRSDGSIIGWGDNGSNRAVAPALPAGEVYTAIAAGAHNSLALRSDGQVVAFGQNSWGNTNVPALPAGVVYTDIAVGYYHSLALRSDGALVAFGYSGHGQLDVKTLPLGTIYSGLGGSSTSLHSVALTKTLVTVTINGSAQDEILVGAAYSDPGATAEDESGNSLAVTVTGAVNANVPGTYVLTYSATDANGIPGSATRVVTVVKKLASDLWLAMMPSYSQNPAYANVTVNDSSKPITVWGRAWNGTPPYDFDLDFGDGTAHYTGTGVSAAAARFIGETHVYTSSGTKTATLTVTDAAGRVETRTAKIRVLVSPTHDDRVNMAIEKGLINLYNVQTNLDADRVYWSVYGWNHSLASGPTGAAVLAFEENGHLPGNDYEEYIYADTVQKGLNHILDFGKGGRMAIPDHSDGIAVRNSDWNGNGLGAYISDETYANTFGGLAIVLSKRSAADAQNTLVSGGPFDGMTYYELIQDVVEQYAWSQGDGSNRGAYHYYPKNQNNGWDGSTMNWPPLLAKAAQDRWNIQPEQWYIDNLKFGFKRQQNANGGIGYAHNNHWLNIAKSGGLLVGYSIDGLGVGDPDVDLSVGYIGNNWRNAPSTGGTNAGWIGEMYAAYGIKKGLSLGGVETIVSSGVTRDWYQDMSAWLLGDAALLDSPGSFGQAGYRNTSYSFGQQWNSGSWSNNGWISNGGGFSTAHAILVLTKSVTVALPIPKIASIPDQSSRNPANITLDGTASTHADPNLSIVTYEWDFDASDGLSWDSGPADATGQLRSVFPDYTIGTTNAGEWEPGSYTVTLRVTDNNNPANSATTTTTVNVLDTDVPPIAKPIPDAQQPPSYSGRIGDSIVIDGADSYDPDGDVITGWAWDLDGNATYGDAADAALDVTGNADGPTATLVFSAEYNGTIGLQVTANGKTGTNSSPVDIVASPSDLYVVSISSDNVVAGVSADITAVLASAADSGKDFTGVVVRFYDGNPFTNGSQIGGGYTVDLPIGGSATVIVPGLPLSAGQEFVYVYVDATGNVDEYDEGNNTASVNVTNKPPVAIAQNVTVSANGNCEGVVTAQQVDNGSSDPDGDPITLTLTPAGPYPLGNTEVTLTVTDDKGMSASAVATITVEDNTAPTVVSSPADEIIECPAVPVFGTPEFADTCDADLTVVSSDEALAVSGKEVSKTKRTWTATDDNGNSVSTSQTITVEDNTAPIVVSGPADEIIECPAVPVFGTPEFADTCDADLTVVSSDEALAVSGKEVSKTKRTWTATDDNGNSVSVSQTITTEDNTPPVITLTGVNPQIIECPQDYEELGATATDTCDTALNAVVIDTSAVDTHVPGDYLVTYNLSDAKGNAAVEVTRTVRVQDTTPPVMTCPAPVCVVSDAGSCDATNVDIGTPITSDNCEVVSVINDHPSMTYPVGETVVTWTVTDVGGNTATCQQTVTVLASVAVTWRPPLKGQPVGNKINVGQVLPHKVLLEDCTGVTMVSGITVTLRIQGINGVTGVVLEDVIEDAQGTGVDGTLASDGIMVLTDSQWHFNVDTGNFGDTNTLASDNYYESTVTVTDNATLKVLGTSSVILETKSRGK